MIEFKNVSFNYDSSEVLKSVNFSISKGEFVAIAGGNGAGKTTTVKLINGLLKPSDGEVLLNGKSTVSLKTSETAKMCGFLFQNPDRQICKNSVYDEILFSLECVGIKGIEREKRISEIAAKLELDVKSDPFNLSRGERQKVALASVIAVKPQILILDEPTTGLDYIECMRIMELIRDLNNLGTTIIMVSHDMEVVADFAKRVIVVEQGKIVLDGECRDVLSRTDLNEISSVLPPQAAELAMRLDKRFDDVFTASEMVERVCELRKGSVNT